MWGVGSSAKQHIRRHENPIEKKVSEHIRSMPFLWLKVLDASSPNSERGYLERNAIALLSNYQKPAIDTPSQRWLGHYCKNPIVKESGIWNVNHVDQTFDPDFLERFKEIIDR
jgi:hypothetical protein